MKIFIIGSAYPLRGGGISTFNERLADILSKDNQVEIFSFSLQYPSFLFPGKSQKTDEPFDLDLKINSVINSINPMNWIKVGKRMKNQRPDLIIIRYWMPFFAPAFATILNEVKKNNHTKIISILDNVLPHEKRIGDVFLTRLFLKKLDAGITMSKSVLQDLRKLGNDIPAVYSPHPMYDNYKEPVDRNESLKHLGLNPDKKYVLFFGFIRRYKGLDLLLEAFDNEQLRHSDIELIIAGEYYEDSKYYTDIIERLQLHSKVHLFDRFIPNADVHFYFSAADIIAQPYRTATQSGISQIAYYYRKPMLVTDVGGLPEIVIHNRTGWVVPIDSDKIGLGILNAFENDNYLEMLTDIDEERKRFEWTYFIKVIRNLYSKIS